MELRKAAPAHIPRIAAAEKICFPADPWPEEILARARERITVAEEDGVLLGYIVFSSVLDEGSVDNIAVLPAYRRRGVAEALLADALAKARESGLAHIYLEVRASNAPARALYEKHGFREVGRRSNYYEKPREDAILMTFSSLEQGAVPGL